MVDVCILVHQVRWGQNQSYPGLVVYMLTLYWPLPCGGGGGGGGGGG